MRVALVALLVLTLVTSAVYGLSSKPTPVKLQGQMVCLWCDVAVKAMPEKASEPHVCTAAFAAADGKVYTLVPDKIGKELGALSMHEQKIEAEGYVLPDSQIFEVTSYKVIEKVKPVTPERNPWFNY
jgi:hypothetical protein